MFGKGLGDIFGLFDTKLGTASKFTWDMQITVDQNTPQVKLNAWSEILIRDPDITFDGA